MVDAAPITCPRCGSEDAMPISQSYVFDPLGLGAAEGLLSRGGGQYGPRVRCHDCGHEWYAPGHAARQRQAEADFARRLREFDERQQSRYGHYVDRSTNVVQPPGCRSSTGTRRAGSP